MLVKRMLFVDNCYLKLKLNNYFKVQLVFGVCIHNVISKSSQTIGQLSNWHIMVGSLVKCFHKTSPICDTTALYEGTHQEQIIQAGLYIYFMDFYRLPLPVNINWRMFLSREQ